VLMSQLPSIGEIKELLPQLKTKDLVDLAGLSPQSLPSNLNMPSEMEFYSTYLNNNSLIVLEISTTSDVWEDYPVKLSNILNIKEVFKTKDPTHIPPEMVHAKLTLPNSSLSPPEVL